MKKTNLSYAIDFKLSITKALRDQLLESLKYAQIAPLTLANILELEERTGVYELYKKTGDHSERVYVGKASTTLAQRLAQHWRKLSGRVGISVKDMYFKCAYVDEDLDASAPEKMLIKKYQMDESISWNTNGFGNKDPGRNRDRSIVQDRHFDALYPVNLDHTPTEQEIIYSTETTVLQLLSRLKEVVPFLIRFPKITSMGPKEKDEISKTIVTIKSENIGNYTVDEWIKSIIQALPSGWQASILPGYVIIYREHANYRSARWYWRKVNGVAVKIIGKGQLENSSLSAGHNTKE